MFYIIGLGLADAKDITIKGLEIIQKCDRVYLESYTSILSVDQNDLEKFYNRTLLVADRELVENAAEDILPKNEEENVGFLVVGDPFGATTHTDLILRARKKGVKVKIIHNASVLNAVGCCGLQLYSYGETVSIPFWSDTWQPDSFYEKIAFNRKNGLHTLCLLDIKVKEPTLESISKKKKVYMPPKFMSVAVAADQLSSIFHKKHTAGELELDLTDESTVVGLARIGSDDQRIVACTLRDMRNVDLGPPLHCLVIPSKNLHPLESEFLLQYVANRPEDLKDAQ